MATNTEAPRVILAPNPSALTGPGTNTFLLGRNHVAVIDPGPDIGSHVDAIIAAGAGRISHIFLTHPHLDHSGAVPMLKRATRAPVYAFGDALAGRSPVMSRLAAAGVTGGGEGLDMTFRPDLILTDGATIETPEWTLEALHTPGHSAAHLSFRHGDTIFCGDLAMGWSTTLISPPDGDLGDFFRSIARLGQLAPARLLPAHGDPIDAPAGRLAALASHRKQRTAQIVGALREGPATPNALARRIYNDIPPTMLPAAARNVFAHLIALAEIGVVTTPGPLGAEGSFVLA